MNPEERRQWNERLASTQALASKATQKERDGDLATAYSLCIQTAQSYLWLIRNTNDNSAKETLKAASTRILGRAEKIKAVKRDVRPARTSCLDKLEQDAVLDASSMIGGQRYAPWSAAAAAEPVQTSMYSDPSGQFKLSEEQRLRLHRFARISELSESPVLLSKTAAASDVSQNCVTDCSVITALMACLHHHKRFSSKLAITCLYPQDSEGWPMYNAQSMYSVKMHCNGIPRKVVIDDYLPVDADNTLLCASMLPSNNYWAALLEKAYVKLHGGYNILGSVPSIDIHALTGWIPEQIDFRASSFRAEQTWRYIKTGFEQGSCLVCLGTGEQSLAVSGKGKLAAKHAFAVLDIQEAADGSRYIVLADPWNLRDAESQLDELSLDESDEGARLYKLAWNYVHEQFHAIYCNWRPDSFESQAVLHSRCSTDEPVLLDLEMGPSASLEPDEVWFLLSRHLTGRVDEAFLGLDVSERSATRPRLNTTVPSSIYNNSSQVLFKYRPERSQAKLSLAISMQGVPTDLRFTLKVFSNCPMELLDGSITLPYTNKLVGSWAGKSAGGNPSQANFIYNPHYRFTTAPTGGTSIQAILSVERRSPINLVLMKENGAMVQGRIQQYETAHIVASSGKGGYSTGTAHLVATDLPAGTYVLIPSTFLAGELADFAIKLQSTHMLDPLLVPQAGAGRFTKSIKGAWTQTNAGGGPRSSSYHNNPRYRLRCDNASAVSVRIVVTPWNDIPVNVTIFAGESGSDILGQEVASSGAYAAYVSGSVTPEVRLRGTEHGYIVVPSIYSAGVEAAFTLLFSSDQPVSIELV